MAKKKSPTSNRSTALTGVKKVKRSYVSQSDVPNHTLDDAMRVPQAIADNYAGEPSAPLHVASALNMAPTSGTFKGLCGASMAYGLTEGGYNASEIAVTNLARRILQPLEEGDEDAARREAVLRPRIVGEFLRKYSGSPLPRHDIALNVIQSLGVPKGRAESVYELILDAAQSVGFITEIKNRRYVDLNRVPIAREAGNGTQNEASEGELPDNSLTPPDDVPPGERQEAAASPSPTASDGVSRRVFITHGKNQSFIEPIKRLLAFGEMMPVVSVDRQSVSKPVPEKVMGDMRTCGAAIIHVDREQKLLDESDNEHVIINPNVLIEIGAAMALYGRRFILLVRQGVQLPSNLQGLYEVRYEGDVLDGNATIRLLEAINDIKNNPMPEINAG